MKIVATSPASHATNESSVVTVLWCILPDVVCHIHLWYRLIWPGWPGQKAKLINPSFKGILHQKNFYRLNLIFWIVMGCGIARFGRRGLKTTETWKFWSQNLSPRGFEARRTWGFEAQHHGVSRGGAGVSRHSAMAPWLGDKFWDRNFQVSVVFRPLRPKRAIPHPITIQNMRFRR